MIFSAIIVMGKKEQQRLKKIKCDSVSFFFPTSCFLSGTLHVGDEIREINGISVANQTVEQLQKMLVSV